MSKKTVNITATITIICLIVGAATATVMAISPAVEAMHNVDRVLHMPETVDKLDVRLDRIEKILELRKELQALREITNRPMTLTKIQNSHD